MHDGLLDDGCDGGCVPLDARARAETKHHHISTEGEFGGAVGMVGCEASKDRMGSLLGTRL